MELGIWWLALTPLPSTPTRATKDLDVLIDNSEHNDPRVIAAIRDFFGGAELDLTTSDLAETKRVFQLGIFPHRIDILTSLPSVADFDEAWRKRVRGRFGDVEANYLSLEDLLHEKEGSERLQDLADAGSLRRYQSKSSTGED